MSETATTAPLGLPAALRAMCNVAASALDPSQVTAWRWRWAIEAVAAAMWAADEGGRFTLEQTPSATEASRVRLAASFQGTAVTAGGDFAQRYDCPTRVSHETEMGGPEDDAWLRSEFASAFSIDAESAVYRLIERVKILPNGGLAAARAFLPYLVRASYAQQNLFLDAILHISTPDDVLCAALLLSKGSAGEAILEAAAGVLEHFGGRSWPALAELATSKDPRCRHFVRAVGYVPATPRAKLEALVELAKNRDLDTRWLASAVAEDVSPEAAAAVWQVLCDDPDVQLRTTAEARLVSLVG